MGGAGGVDGGLRVVPSHYGLLDGLGTEPRTLQHQGYNWDSYEKEAAIA